MLSPARRFGFALILAFMPAVAGVAAAQNSNGGALVAINSIRYRVPFVTVPQADSGALVLFQDARNGTTDVYSQRVNRRGVPQNGEGGALVWSMPISETVDAWIADGSGGVVLAKAESRGATGRDIVLRRVASDGTQPYGANGLVICNAPGDQTHPLLVLGPTKSIYVVWVDDRTEPGFNQDVYAQRVNLAGSVVWAANGVVVNSSTYQTTSSGLTDAVSDFSGGLIVMWGPWSPTSTRAQRLSSSGTLAWNTHGIQLGSGSAIVRSCFPDGTGGVWGIESRWDGTYTYLNANRLTAAGVLATPAGGVQIHTPVYNATPTCTGIRTSTSGAMFITMAWVPNSSSQYVAMERQELGPTGTVLKSGNGDVLGQASSYPDLFDSGNDWLMLTREVVTPDLRIRMRIQRYSLGGTAFYPGLGVVVGRDEPNRSLASAALGMASNGVIACAWADGRYITPLSQYSYQAFGQSITSTGAALWDDVEVPSIQSARDAADDQGGQVRVTWSASLADHPAARIAKGYRVWRALSGAFAASLAEARPRQAGRYRMAGRDLLLQADTFWELAGEQPAVQLAGYAKTVPTLMDSVAGNAADQLFMVEAYDDSSHHWFSTSLNAHSVDNLAPAMPPSAAGYYAGSSTSLFWGGVPDVDLCCYDVFRGSTPGFTPSEANRLGTTNQVTFTDLTAGAFFYRIAARDIHDNRGASALVTPAGTTDVDNAQPRAWRLDASWRGGELRLALDLPQADEGRLDLFDVSGRRVWSSPYRSEVARSLAFTVPGARQLPAGVVYARALSASGQEQVSKAVVLK